MLFGLAGGGRRTCRHTPMATGATICSRLTSVPSQAIRPATRVLREERRQGVGRKLLAKGEAEIAARGYRTCRLRVVRSKAVAVQLYLNQGWKIAREFAREKYRHPMLELAKSSDCSTD